MTRIDAKMAEKREEIPAQMATPSLNVQQPVFPANQTGSNSPVGTIGLRLAAYKGEKQFDLPDQGGVYLLLGQHTVKVSEGSVHI